MNNDNIDKLVLKSRQIKIKTDYKKKFIGINEISGLIEKAIKNGKNKIYISSKRLRNVDAQKLLEKGYNIKKNKFKKFAVSWNQYENLDKEKLEILEYNFNEVKKGLLKQNDRINKLEKKIEGIVNTLSYTK